MNFVSLRLRGYLSPLCPNSKIRASFSLARFQKVGKKREKVSKKIKICGK